MDLTGSESHNHLSLTKNLHVLLIRTGIIAIDIATDIAIAVCVLIYAMRVVP